MYRIICLIISFALTIYAISSKIEFYDLEKPKYINVEIKGEVKEDRTIQLPLGSNIGDALKYVDLNEDADLDNISNLQTLYDNQIVVISKKPKKDTRISINSARQEELTKLPGIGEQIAKRIIEYRTNNGSFIELDELMNVKGIGINKYEKLKQYICL